MQILLTGCAGYIGSVVSKKLIEKQFRVIGLDNLSTGFRENIPLGVDFYEGDIADTAILKDIQNAYPELDTVIHLAGFIEVAESVKNPEKYYENNSHKAKVFLDSLVSLGFKNIIYSSTAAVYGIPETKSLIKEESLLAPINPYGASKLEFEKYIQKSSLNYIIFRFFNVAGADADSGECHDPETHLIPLLLDFSLGKRSQFSIYGTDYDTEDGTAVRDYIHVKDLALAHLLAVEALLENENFSKFAQGCREKPSGWQSCKVNHVYNLGYGAGFSVKQIVKITEKLLGRALNYSLGNRRVGDPACLVADPTKAVKLLGFNPEYSSIETIINDALKHREMFYSLRK